MKFKARKLKLRKKYLIIALVLIGVTVFSLSSNLFTKKLFGEYSPTFFDKKTNTTNIKNETIKDFEETYTILEEKNINEKVVSILTKENDRYMAKMFDKKTEKEIELKDIVDLKSGFNEKINELINLKYPKFIANVLTLDNQEKVYYFKENELIIYFYDYEITPAINEELFLKVNYNEIKDYLKIDVTLDKEYENEDGSKIDLNKKLIALTFDDGPGNYTEKLVDILNDNKATATFFMLGKKVKSFKNAVKKVDENNMEIGYHSWNHTSFKRQKLEEIENELKNSNEILKSIIGKEFTLIRPPYGSINNEIKEKLNNPLIFWNIDTEDWRHKDVEYLLNYTKEHVKDGSIILFHDIHKSSVDAMEVILPELYALGYQVTTVSNLASTFNVKLENHQSYRHFTR